MTAPARYTKRPVTIEAMRLHGTPSDHHAVYQWIETNTLGSFDPMPVIRGRVPYPASGVSIDPRDGRLIVSTLEGLHWANEGDWIIRGVRGEFYPCTPGIFAATYEPAAPDPLAAHPRAAAIRTVARKLLADAAERIGAEGWDVHSGLGEYDWKAVAIELTRLAPPVDGAAYLAAYQVLTDAAGEG